MNEQLTARLPTDSNHFKARYAPWIGSVLLILGLVNLLLVLWVMLLTGEFNVGIITGVVVTVVGYLYLTRPYFAIAPNRLTLYNLLGSPVKRYPFATFGDISLEGARLYIKDANDPNQREKVKVSKWMTKGADWRAIGDIVG
ncbi:MAG: hypothetical protein AAFP07_18970 [Cyanobacteria bacterium J06606_4]